MNQMTNQNPNQLLPMGGGELPAEERAIMSFFDLRGAALAIESEQFTQEEMVRRIIEHIRDGDPAVSQRGILQFKNHIRELATVNGRIGTARMERINQDENGNRTKQVASSVTLLSRLQGTRPGGPSSVSQGYHVAGAVSGENAPDKQPEPHGPEPSFGGDSPEPSGEAPPSLESS